MTFVKDPGEVLDYQIDWAAWLGTDTITSSTWTVTGATKVATSSLNAVTTVWVSGGTLGVPARATNTVVTAGGRTGVRSVDISIEAK